MKKLVSLVIAACCAGLMTGTLRVIAEEKAGTAAEKKAAVAQSVFVCPHCHTLALKTGKCDTCEKELKQTHVLCVKDGNALCCGCGSDCKCSAADMKDEKCGCGKAVTKVSVKGKYVCAGGCPEIADKPGTCACGKELKKVE